MGLELADGIVGDPQAGVGDPLGEPLRSGACLPRRVSVDHGSHLLDGVEHGLPGRPVAGHEHQHRGRVGVEQVVGEVLGVVGTEAADVGRHHDPAVGQERWRLARIEDGGDLGVGRDVLDGQPITATQLVDETGHALAHQRGVTAAHVIDRLHVGDRVCGHGASSTALRT